MGRSKRKKKGSPYQQKQKAKVLGTWEPPSTEGISDAGADFSSSVVDFENDDRPDWQVAREKHGVGRPSRIRKPNSDALNVEASQVLQTRTYLLSESKETQLNIGWGTEVVIPAIQTGSSKMRAVTLVALRTASGDEEERLSIFSRFTWQIGRVTGFSARDAHGASRIEVLGSAECDNFDIRSALERWSDENSANPVSNRPQIKDAQFVEKGRSRGRIRELNW